MYDIYSDDGEGWQGCGKVLKSSQTVSSRHVSGSREKRLSVALRHVSISEWVGERLKSR